MKNAPTITCVSFLQRRFVYLLLTCAMLAALLLTGCASSAGKANSETKDALTEIESRWGIRMEGIRVTASGHLIDFRFRVLDPEKAANLMRRGSEAYIVDQTTGIKLPVPMTKVGHLRGTGTKPIAGRVYPVLFASGGGIVHQGSSVTIVLGEFRAENLVVE